MGNRVWPGPDPKAGGEEMWPVPMREGAWPALTSYLRVGGWEFGRWRVVILMVITPTLPNNLELHGPDVMALWAIFALGWRFSTLV